VTHTLQGQRIFAHFIIDICSCETLWTPANIIDDAVERVRETVGSEKVLLIFRVASTTSVVAALLHRAIGDHLTCVFVDNGLLRKNEGNQVMDMFARNMGVRILGEVTKEFTDLLREADAIFI